MAGVEKRTGIIRVIAAGGYSLDGFRRMLLESAFRHELLYYLVAVILFVISGAVSVEYLILTMIFLFMLGIEALNTAIEELVDRVSPEISETGKHAKNLGSFAVFCTLLAAALYIGWVVFF